MPAKWSNYLKEAQSVPATSAAKSGYAWEVHLGFLLVGGQDHPQSCNVKRSEREGASDAPCIPATGIPGVGIPFLTKWNSSHSHQVPCLMS